MKLPKLPNVLKNKKSRSSSQAGSSRSSSSRSSSFSSGAASPARNSSDIPRFGEIARSGEIGRAAPGITHRSPARYFEHQELSNAFKLIDVNDDGKISPSELGTVLSSLGYTSSEEELRLILDAVDTDGDGFIDMQEFINHNMKMDKAGSPARTKELRAAFDVFDIDRNNFISAEELFQVLKGLGEKSTMEDCSRMIRGVDSDGDGQVNFEEFERMMRSTWVC